MPPGPWKRQVGNTVATLPGNPLREEQESRHMTSALIDNAVPTSDRARGFTTGRLATTRSSHLPAYSARSSRSSRRYTTASTRLSMRTLN